MFQLFRRQNRRTSTKEESLSKAKEIAEDWYLQLRGKPRTREIKTEKILDEENLRFDREGRPRTAYNLRLTYICLRLMEGADIYQIAKNCRANVEMIEKYYAAHIKTNLDAAAINIMRPKPKKIGKGERRTQNRPAPSTPHTDV